MIVEFEWFPPWKDELGEDRKLQERAAERLVNYMRDGRMFLNGKHMRLAAADVVTSTYVKDSSDGTLGIRFSVDLDVRVTA